MVSDNKDRNLDFKIEGTYNFNQIGEYPLKVIVIDSDKNKTEKSFILKVNKKEEKKPETILEKKEKEIALNKKKDISPIVNNVIPHIIPQQQHQNIKKGTTFKRFLFKDGYNFRTVVPACVQHLNQIGSGTCEPIKENGIYIGMIYKP